MIFLLRGFEIGCHIDAYLVTISKFLLCKGLGMGCPLWSLMLLYPSTLPSVPVLLLLSSTPFDFCYHFFLLPYSFCLHSPPLPNMCRLPRTSYHNTSQWVLFLLSPICAVLIWLVVIGCLTCFFLYDCSSYQGVWFGDYNLSKELLCCWDSHKPRMHVTLL